ncbi:MAG: hypothetical protein J6V66_03605 [Clostridia bacterium]|nr:hypothetical protein [Clostridia bacterium]
MIKTIKITKTVARLKDNEPFLLPDSLSFDFENEVGYDLTHAVISLKNGEKTVKLRLMRPVVIPNELLFAGRLYVNIDLYNGDKVIKHYELLPLAIEEAENTVKIYDELDDLKKRIEKLEKFHEII